MSAFSYPASKSSAAGPSFGRNQNSASRVQARISLLLATLIACAVLLPLLGHKALADWDEGIYAEVSREFLGGSWIVPHWHFQPWFEKPPWASG